MKIRHLLSIVLITAAIGFFGLVRVDAISSKVNVCHKTESIQNPWVAQSVNANELQSHLDNGDFLYFGPVNKQGQPTSNSWCNGHVPTPTPTVTPTNVPSPTPKPCFVWHGEFPIPCPTVTPTATPSVTPTLSPTPTQDPGNGMPPSFAGSTTEAPGAPSCSVGFDHPLLQGFKVNSSTSVTFSWWGVSNVDKYSIRYGYKADALIYGADNLPSNSTSFTINALQPGNHVWAIVTAWRGGCAEDSNLLDPVLPRHN